jgi:CHAT domain/SIR2-like domain
MSSQNTIYGEIEIGIHQVQPEVYEVELRVNDPRTAGEITPVRGQAHISLNELQALHYSPLDYGQKLTDQLFQDIELHKFYGKNRAVFEAAGIMIRLRLLIDSSAPELHSLRWELLLDPDTKQRLTTSERVLFSRFMVSRDWRVIKLRPKAELKAIIAVSAPNDLVQYRLAEVDKGGEIARAREALAGIRATAVGEDLPLTLVSLMQAIRQGTDVLYLVCHGAMPKGEAPCLFLQDAQGKTARVMASDLAQKIGELQEAPRLIVMASCESAGREEDVPVDGTSAAQSALAPQLAEAGVPAVVAMQGKITMETVKQAMPVFFHELLQDGQIDRAMAVARGVVRERPDSWMPALFLRLKSGRIWYEPGFAGEDKNQFEKWKSICNAIRKKRFVPIVGPELGEDVFGGTRELANRLAEKHAFPLESYERTDLAKVTQYISTNQDRTYAGEVVQDQFLRQVSERLDGGSNGNGQRTLSELLDLATQRCVADQEHPYRILADLPASIYLNASYEPMLYRSLQATGKNPERIFTAWRGVEVPKQPQPTQATPTEQVPWLYHIFGLFGYPDTMVLTEDDFFDYLITTSQLDLLPSTLVGRLMQSSLLFLGFRLDDWRFRVLFRMIINKQGTQTMKELSHVGVQVNPDEQSIADVERARSYMESYFRGGKTAPEISIYWGSPADFLKQLHDRLADFKDDDVVAPENYGKDW